jgi:hypothetical protein
MVEGKYNTGRVAVILKKDVSESIVCTSSGGTALFPSHIAILVFPFDLNKDKYE